MTSIETDPTATPAAPTRTPSQRLASAIHALGRALNAADAGTGTMSGGELAALRRLDPDAPWSAHFYRRIAWLETTQGVQLAADSVGRDEDERRWAVIFNGMAICAGLHREGIPAGAALGRCLSEARFVKLAQARGASLRGIVRTTARQVASAGEPLDWSGLARLVLSEGQNYEDEVRRDLARAFFGELYKRSQSEGPADED